MRKVCSVVFNYRRRGYFGSPGGGSKPSRKGAVLLCGCGSCSQSGSVADYLCGRRGSAGKAAAVCVKGNDGILLPARGQRLGFPHRGVFCNKVIVLIIPAAEGISVLRGLTEFSVGGSSFCIQGIMLFRNRRRVLAGIKADRNVRLMPLGIQGDCRALPVGQSADLIHSVIGIAAAV